MKEITRIHIAKIVYEIEIDAKKALETYLKNLEVYANDTELLNDIEIRITELLADRGIVKNGVIALPDIEAIEKQLGEPRDFMDGDDVPTDAKESLSDEPVRKLYRNTDNAVLGGVLSGAASYFKIDPLWLRIAAVVLFFASSGVALLVYLALCLVIPPARTAAEKLRMSGRPVTLASLREMGDDSATREVSQRRAQALRRFATRSAGVLSVLGSLVALGVTIVVVFHITFGVYDTLDTVYNIISFSLAVVAGVLLALLFALAAYCAFAQKITKRLLIIGAIIIALGLSSAAASAGVVWYGRSQNQQITERDTKTVTTSLPADFASVKSLTVNAQGARVQYRTSSATPHMELSSLPDMNARYTLDGTTATISVLRNNVDGSQYRYVSPILTIYGPALEDIRLVDGRMNYEAGNQESLNVHVLSNDVGSNIDDAIVSIDGGVIDKLSFISENNEWLTMAADGASVRSVEAKLRVGDTLRLGKIEKLAVTYPDVCASGTQQTSVVAAAVQASTMIINQRTVQTQSMHEACGKVQIGTSNSQ